MTEPTTEQDKTLAIGKPKEIRVVSDSGPLANLIDTARFEHCFRIAEAMSMAPLIPDHLRGNKHGEFTALEKKANCFLIVNQSLRWGMDPFAVMPETYVVGGKLAYQGKLIAAVVNAKAGLKKRLIYTYSGTKGRPDFTITVSGTFLNEDEPREVSLSVGEAKTENQMWSKDPEQKLVYSGVIRWARRYTPEIMLGILTDDDLDRMDSWRAEAARQAKEVRMVEKPDFTLPAAILPGNIVLGNIVLPETGTQSDPPPPDPAPVASAMPSKPESKGKTAARKADSPQNRLFGVLTQERINQTTFVEDLKAIKFARVPADAELVHELSDETCEAILNRGLSQILEDIADAKAWEDVKK